LLESYTLVRVQPSKDYDIYTKIEELNEVKEVITTYGEYDAIIKVEVNNLDELDDLVFKRLRRMDGVEATMTLISARFPR
jgi:DNA-binding Lrp family transcriptional regulator